MPSPTGPDMGPLPLVLRTLVFCGAGIIAMLGFAGAMVSMSPRVILGTAGCAAVVGHTVHRMMAIRDRASVWFLGPAATAWGAAAAGVVLAGWFMAFGAGSGALVVLLAAWGVVLWYWRCRVTSIASPDNATPVDLPSPPEPPPPPPAPEPRSLTDEQLSLAWRSSYTALQRAHDPADAARVVDTRAGYLDELQRRDPSGFVRWMVTGARAASDPAKYLTADREKRSDNPGT